MLIIHESTRDFIFPLDRNRLHIRLQIHATTTPICKIIYWNRFHPDDISQAIIPCVGVMRDEVPLALSLRGSSDPKQSSISASTAQTLPATQARYHHETDLVFSETAQYIKYYFELETATGTYTWGRHGLEGQPPTTTKPGQENVAASHQAPPPYCFEYLNTAELDIVSTPAWARGATWYQIFPERFNNGDPANDPANCDPWDATPTRENHCGGDLAGIREKLPYLQELGVDVLYLTPVFAAPSNHKYDTVDYFSIDPAFGTEQDLIDLVRQCHTRSEKSEKNEKRTVPISPMKIVLDGVFNHIGYHSPQFQDVLANGAASPYADWFYIDSFPVRTDPPNYECVGYFKWMPKLRFKTPAVRDFFIRVGLHWIETADIDGWRLDVADEVDFTFWQEFRHAIKAVKPEAILLAETWKDGRDLLRGDQMDTVMNYLFRDAVLDFFARRTIDAATFERRLTQMLFGYSVAHRSILYNMLGSHDTARFLSEAGGDLLRLKLAALFQFSFPGMPVIYYGDEVGMTGENDPDCRRTYPWDDMDKGLLAHFQRLTALRRELESLRLGDFKCLYAAGHVIAFARSHGVETTYIIINNGEAAHSALIPMLEDAGTITEQHSAFSDFCITPEPLDINTRLHNGDIFEYKGFFRLTLEGGGYEVVTVRQ